MFPAKCEWKMTFTLIKSHHLPVTCQTFELVIHFSMAKIVVPRKTSEASRWSAGSVSSKFIHSKRNVLSGLNGLPLMLPFAHLLPSSARKFSLQRRTAGKVSFSLPTPGGHHVRAIAALELNVEHLVEFLLNDVCRGGREAKKEKKIEWNK